MTSALHSRLRRVLSGLLSAVFLSFMLGCASTGGTTNPRDPFESFNRSVYQFNDTVDRYTLKPVAQGYQRFVPEPLASDRRSAGPQRRGS